MISRLSNPSVCVIDDEEEDYRPILDALNSLYVSCVHLKGDAASLPSRPFEGLRLIFLDLHLTGSVGRSGASHTANVFRKVVSSETAPIVVVIWSKFAKDALGQEDVPAEDQETEADLFKRFLVEAEPAYKERLVFIEMKKPKQNARPGRRDWTRRLRTQIRKTLKGQSAVDALWAWELLVTRACNSVSEELTRLAVAGSPVSDLKAGLSDAMKRLTKAQSEGDLSAKTAPRYFAGVLTQLLMDQLEHATGLDGLSTHGPWLAAPVTGSPPFAKKLNGLLLTASVDEKSPVFGPGTIYKVVNPKGFKTAFGVDVRELVMICSVDSKPQSPAQQARLNAWELGVRPVAIELSPACDVANNKRVTSLLVGGVIVPASMLKQVMNKDAWTMIPLSGFHLRWAADDYPAQDSVLVFCHRFKSTLSAKTTPRWIKPWFRLREIPTTSLRNDHAGFSSRVGYVTL